MCKKDSGRKPLIHCITNPIAMNQSANAVLALGARPIMAEHPKEVKEITETADALLINFGNISDVRMESMMISLKTANAVHIPVVVDVCGVACSHLRLDFFEELTKSGTIRVIKGNYSEVLALYDRNYRGSGVDASGDIEKEAVERAVAFLVKTYGAMVLATGKEDILAFKKEQFSEKITDYAVKDAGEESVKSCNNAKSSVIIDGIEVIRITGGCAQMGTVTGTGCMLGAIIATFLAFDDSKESVEKAAKFFGECGNRAKTDKGGGTFMVNLIDALGEHDEF